MILTECQKTGITLLSRWVFGHVFSTFSGDVFLSTANENINKKSRNYTEDEVGVMFSESPHHFVIPPQLDVSWRLTNCSNIIGYFFTIFPNHPIGLARLTSPFFYLSICLYFFSWPAFQQDHGRGGVHWGGMAVWDVDRPSRRQHVPRLRWGAGRGHLGGRGRTHWSSGNKLIYNLNSFLSRRDTVPLGSQSFLNKYRYIL